MCGFPRSRRIMQICDVKAGHVQSLLILSNELRGSECLRALSSSRTRFVCVRALHRGIIITKATGTSVAVGRIVPQRILC